MSEFEVAELNPKIVIQKISDLRAFSGNARTHSKKQLGQIADSMKRFGFTNPVLVSEGLEIIAGHGRVEAAKMLGLEEVPTIALPHLSEAERRAYILADNKLALNAGWDQETLAIELQWLVDVDFEVELTGFSNLEIDLVLDSAGEASIISDENPEDEIPAVQETAVSRSGDIWVLDHHKLLCGDARNQTGYDALFGSETADIIFTDPPYNVTINGNVTGLGKQKHREFAMGSGEMTGDEFTLFLKETLGPAAQACRDGAIAYVCMDWRHIRELVEAGACVFDEYKNLVIWNKTNGGMGSFYRSKHELIGVFKIGTAAHTNNFGLGDTGRYRTNVWDYAGISSMSATRDEELKMHPTVKPVALIADALRDCSKRGDIVLDCFGGSGSTLIAAQTTGRRARLIEYDPLYCDTIVRRWERFTGKQAKLRSNSQSFDQCQHERCGIDGSEVGQ
ncbi:DNA methyltransferase [Parasphingorhabdus sp.]|uniref:site-specific DNA-methyltransferase n=1 Tax=Parasphingorhabdus sp. TaxID=2709688 RepID=UPI0032EE0475